MVAARSRAGDSDTNAANDTTHPFGRGGCGAVTGVSTGSRGGAGRGMAVRGVRGALLTGGVCPFAVSVVSFGTGVAAVSGVPALEPDRSPRT